MKMVTLFFKLPRQELIYSRYSSILGFARENQQIKYTEIFRKIYYEGLSHAIIEKPHSMLSAKWKPRKVSSVVPIQT